MRYLSEPALETTEKVFWLFVLIVGRKIKQVSNKTKNKYWLDHFFMSILVVVPTAALELVCQNVNPLIYISLVSIGFTSYVAFVYKWRKYLSTLSLNQETGLLE